MKIPLANVESIGNMRNNTAEKQRSPQKSCCVAVQRTTSFFFAGIKLSIECLPSFNQKIGDAR